MHFLHFKITEYSNLTSKYEQKKETTAALRTHTFDNQPNYDI